MLATEFLHDEGDYNRVDSVTELTLEEKHALIFTLVEKLGFEVHRAKFDESFTVLVTKRSY